MTFNSSSYTFISLAGSDVFYTPPPAALCPLDKSGLIDVILVLWPGKDAGGDTAAGKKIVSFAHKHGLQVVSAADDECAVTLRAPIAAFEEVFRVQLMAYRDANGEVYRSRAGCIYIPSSLSDAVVAVMGLDNMPVAQPHHSIASRYAARPMPVLGKGYMASQVADLYNFPKGAQGTGQCIGIIALGGGYRPADLDRYFSRLGLATPHIENVYLNGVRNAPTVPNSHDREIMLDIQVAGAIAPGARIVVYFSQNNDKGFYDALHKAIYDKVHAPGIITISWGAAEKKWARQSMNAYNDLFRKAAERNITICAASGDAGSSDSMADGKVHVDFPASSPYVLACGGTHLVAKNGRICTETVWHESDHAASGGGVSEVFPLPEYQAAANVPASLNISGFRGRGVPDVAGNAAHATGYHVIVDGVAMVIGGTSAVAPLYAGLVARLNEMAGYNLGFINPYFYDNPQFFREIIKGNNITVSPRLGYVAGPGWNACTGLGVIADFRLKEDTQTCNAPAIQCR